MSPAERHALLAVSSALARTAASGRSSQIVSELAAVAPALDPEALSSVQTTLLTFSALAREQTPREVCEAFTAQAPDDAEWEQTLRPGLERLVNDTSAA